MIADIKGQLQLIAATTTKDDTAERASYSLEQTYGFKTQVDFGTGPGKANKQIQKEVTVENGTPLSLDLEDGTEIDSYGGVFDANLIKSFAIHHKIESLASSIEVTGLFLSDNNLGTISLAPGETHYVDKFQVGIPCGTGATNDVITFTNPDAVNTDALIQYLFYGDDA